MENSSGGTVVKRIQLKVESATPQLSAIDSAIERIVELNRQLVAAGALSGRLSANLGGTFAGFGNSAASAAAQVKAAMGESLAATERTSRAIASMAKMPPVPGLGRLYAVNRSFANEGNYQAGDPQYRQEIFKSRGTTTKRSTVDNENFQYQESVNYDKFWNDAIKVGEKQRVRDIKAQQLWREHNRTWSDIRDQKDIQQEVLTSAPLTTRGGNSQRAIEAQAAAAERDIKINERMEARQRSAFLNGRAGYSSPIGPTQPGQVIMGGVQGYTNPIGPAMNYRNPNPYPGRVGYPSPIGPQNQGPVRMAGVQGYQNPIGPAMGYGSGSTQPKGQGGFGFSAGMSFLNKLGTAATWYAAYTAIHKVGDGVEYSYQRMQQLDLQTARLSQVFRGVGGNANQLADDTLKLAAAEGRGTDEAMASAVAWSRLGLTRREVNEAVKISLMAANVAEISAGDATQSLSSIMAGFNLQVSDLGPALGILNQQSNTYRVTVGELMQGLSRVSGIAQGAGLSLAQLTGILTVSVQKTGQTGANIANSLKTTLVRLNRDDVQQFFKKRYGMNVTGTAEDLSKIQMAYMKGNEEQKRDIILKVGSATQANRLRAIFDTYTESVFAAVDSLTHLNSAEMENLKITNTVSAATQRAASSWDRFVNSTSSYGPAAYFRGALNTTAGVISGVTGGPSSKGGQAKYFNPDLASGAGSLFGAANLVSFGGAGLIGEFSSGMHDLLHGKGFGHGVERFKSNYWASLGFTDTPTTQDQFHQVEIGKINNLVGREEAGKDKAGVLEDLAKNWQSFSPEVQKREREVLGKGGRVTKDTLAKLDAGDTSGLMDEAKAAREDAKKARHAEVLRVNANVTDRERDLAKEQDPTKRAELEGQITELKKQQNRLFKDDLDAEKDSEKTLYAIAKALAEQREYAQEIAGAFKGLGLGAYEEKLLTLNYQIAQTDAMAKSLSEKDPVASDALNKKKEELQSELDAAQSPLVKRLDQAGSDKGVASQMAGFEVESQGVGLSEGEKLLDRQKFINQERAKLANLSKDSTNDLIRYEVLLTAAKATGLSIAQRTLEVDKERKQTAIDTQREFQKSLIGAGPGELLRKLAEAQLAGKNGNRIRTAGQFFSLTGESQRDVYQLMGGERMASLNAEARALRGKGQNVLGAQQSTDAIDTTIQQVAAEYGRRLLGNGTSVMAPAVVAQATAALNKTSSAADKLTLAFDRLTIRVNGTSNSPGSNTTATNSAPSATPVSQAPPVDPYNPTNLPLEPRTLFDIPGNPSL